jgi:hypothetical protein
MADLVTTTSTTLPTEEVTVRAVQFFTNERWRMRSQTNRIATFVGISKVPFIRILLALMLTFFFVIPGVVYYFFVIARMRKLRNIVVTTTPSDTGCSVVVSYPKSAHRLVENFVAALPGTTLATAATAAR